MGPHQQRSKRIGERHQSHIRVNGNLSRGGPTSAQNSPATRNLNLRSERARVKIIINFSRKIMNRCGECWWTLWWAFWANECGFLSQLGKTREYIGTIEICLRFCADVTGHDHFSFASTLVVELVFAISDEKFIKHELYPGERQMQLKLKCKLLFEHKNMFHRLRLIDMWTWWPNRITPNSMRFAFGICVWLKSIDSFFDCGNSFAVRRLCSSTHSAVGPLIEFCANRKRKKCIHFWEYTDFCHVRHDIDINFAFMMMFGNQKSDATCLSHRNRAFLRTWNIALWPDIRLSQQSDQFKFQITSIKWLFRESKLLYPIPWTHERTRLHFNWNREMRISMKQTILISFNSVESTQIGATTKWKWTWEQWISHKFPFHF